MIIRFGKHSSETFTIVVDVRNVSPHYENGELTGYHLILFSDSDIEKSIAPKQTIIYVHKDFDPDCFEILEDDDTPCMWLMKEKLSTLGISARDYESAEDFADAIRNALAAQESEEEFKGF